MVYNMRGSRNFCQGGGGGGVPGPTARNSSDNVFFQLILQFYNGLSMVYYKENYDFPRFQRGSNIFQGVEHFPGGSNFFQGVGLNANIYRNPKNL